MPNQRHFPWSSNSERKGGYPAGNKPVSEIKPPPRSVSKPKPKDGS